jgi:cation transport protein ChaC
MAKTALWIFGYGSLMWNPGFAHDAREIARLDGFHRCFCMRSVHHRGTPEAPGLVLALDKAKGRECSGVAFRVRAGAEAETLAYLRERELVSSAYLEVEITLSLSAGRELRALTYIVDSDHVQYCGDLPLDEQARIIARSHGGRGPNAEYLFNTVAQLAELGLHDPDLEWLADRVRQEMQQTGAAHTSLR